MESLVKQLVKESTVAKRASATLFTLLSVIYSDSILAQAAAGGKPTRSAPFEFEEVKDQQKTLAEEPIADTSSPKDNVKKDTAATEGVVSTARGESFVSPKKIDDFVDSLGSISRKSAGDGGPKAIKSVLDLRLPMIDRACDVTVSHEMIKLGYAYYANFNGADEQLRRVAEAITNRSDGDFRGVTPSCKAALRGFSYAVLKVHLGADWTDADEQKVQRIIESDAKSGETSQPVPKRYK